MHIAFQKNAWDESAVTHAYTYRFPYTNRFIQHEDAIENGANPEMADGFDYLSIMSREAFPTGTRITTHCSFSGNAAPLLIFSDALDLCEDGVYRYGNYFEVVLYKSGLNVWRLWRGAAAASFSTAHAPAWRKELGSGCKTLIPAFVSPERKMGIFPMKRRFSRRWNRKNPICCCLVSARRGRSCGWRETGRK